MIRKLPELLANRIAAGEVVERPASVVKECVENSIDAGATYIEIIIRDGGKTLMQIVDDGSGIAPDDLPLALERHATSKISTFDDLDAITTLGFRGEALASIASVAEVEIVSRLRGEKTAHAIRCDFGKITDFGPTAAQQGTTVTIKNLFALVPARKKFLKTDKVETNRIIAQVQKLALAKPEISFRLECDTREIIYSPATGTYIERIEQLFGAEISEKLMPAHGSNELYAVEAYVSPRDFCTSSSSEVYMFLNSRPIASALLLGAIRRVYAQILPHGRYPYVFMFLEASPDSVDVNVHPAKTEVRFKREETVFGIVYKALAAQLETDFAPAAQVLPSQPIVTPAQSETPAKISRSNALFDDVPRPYAGKKMKGLPEKPIGTFDDAFSLTKTELAMRDAANTIERESLFAEGMQFLQILDSYIIIRSPRGAMIIDQHAAHERVLFERVYAAIDHEPAVVQRLLFGIELSLSPRQLDATSVLSEHFLHTGFEVSLSEKSRGKIEITGAPSFVKTSEIESIVRKILDDFCNTEVRTSDIPREFAASVACHSAIRAGQRLSDDDMRSLFESLFACDNPTTCPHGRPTIVEFSAIDFEKMFARRQ